MFLSKKVSISYNPLGNPLISYRVRLGVGDIGQVRLICFGLRKLLFFISLFFYLLFLKQRRYCSRYSLMGSRIMLSVEGNNHQFYHFWKVHFLKMSSFSVKGSLNNIIIRLMLSVSLFHKVITLSIFQGTDEKGFTWLLIYKSIVRLFDIQKMLLLGRFCQKR